MAGRVTLDRKQWRSFHTLLTPNGGDLFSLYIYPKWPRFAHYTDEAASEGGGAPGKDNESTGKLCESLHQNSPLPHLI